MNNIKQLERTYPPLSRVDTIVVKNGQPASVHGTTKIFRDEDIITVRQRSLPAPKLCEDEKKFKIAITKSGKTVLQQQATRGCTAACVEMLKSDHGIKIDWNHMRNCNLGNTESKKYSLEKAGLKPIVSNVPLKLLNDAIFKNGPAMIAMDDGSGGHCIIVDKVDYKDKMAYIRDPYHGWAIVVKLETFCKVIGGKGPSEIIQVQTKK